ncbi:MAG TPA: signal recognition particle-docking protein FtsY [Acidobacteriota bacterium]|nr:signal recognition particle-docking protein FtsY [Acidobacteriota bacterium]
MFGFLKDKLKGALSMFSKKAEETGKKTEEIVEKKVEVKPEPKIEKKKEIPVEEDKKAKKVEEKKEVKKVEVKKIEIKAGEPKEEKPEVKVEKKVEVTHSHKPADIKQEKPLEKAVEKKPGPKIEKKVEISPQKQDVKSVEEIAPAQTKPQPEKKSFFGKLFSKKQDIKPEETKVEQSVEPAPAKETQVKQHVKTEVNAEVTTIEKPVETEVKPEKKSFFQSITEKITKSTLSQEQFDDLFFELEIVLLENNVAVQVIEKIKADLIKNIVGVAIKRGETEATILKTLKASLDEILSFHVPDLLDRVSDKKPYIIAFIGVNGAGKTTNLAKVANYLQKHNKTCVIAACDTFRAAAIHQLEEHANKLGVKIIKQDYGADAAAVAFDAVAHAKSKGIDVVLVDTAGRLHSNSNLMDELAKIERVIKPDLKLFVGESVTGNDCVEQAMQFDEKIGIDGIILSKADVDEKGGAAISVAYVTKKPIYFIGTGQTYDDLEPFSKEKILASLEL